MNLRSAGRAVCIALVVLISCAARAQVVIIYDDAFQNGFSGDDSFGGGYNPAATAQFHSGTKSISLLGNNYNAVTFTHPSGVLSTASYPVLRLWVRAGAANQHLQIFLHNGANSYNGSLDSYISGGSMPSGTWVQAIVNLTQAPLSYNGNFDRIDLQWDSGAAAIAGEEIYIDDVNLGQTSAASSNAMTIEHDVMVGPVVPDPPNPDIDGRMLSDRFTWRDSSNHPRVAALAHNDNGALANGAKGGTLREFSYQLSNGTTRVLTVTTYDSNSAYAGFGFVVCHSAAGNCVADDSPLGAFFPGHWSRVFEGTHHAIFRFTQDYPRNCSTNASGSHTIPVTIDWLFMTGHDNPLYAITYDVDLASPAAAAGTFYDDSRAPYGELNIDGEGYTDIDGTAWGDRYKFTTTSAPVMLNSTWDWTQTNTVPYIKEWLNGPIGVAPNYNRDATMGLVQTQTNAQQDAAGARGPNVHDVTPFWGKTSADGNAGNGYSMPWQDDWPYQANADSVGVGASNNNARLTWRTQYGFLGPNTYPINDGVGETVKTAPGYPKKSYSVYVVMGQHSTLPVEAQRQQVETMQSVTLTASTGSVVTSGPAGITRAQNVTYAPAGYNHVYGALAFSATGNALDANIAVGAGTLKNPLVIISNYSGSDPTVKLGGVTLTADADYYASLRPSATELWLTLNASLSGATNHLQITSSAAGAPAAPVNVSAAAFSTTRVDITWDAVAGANSYQVDRMSSLAAGFGQIATPATNSYADTTALAGKAYLYRVRAVNASGTSGNSASDLATTILFTDPALAVGMTIRAVHLAELRTAVDAVRTLANLGAGAYSDTAQLGTKIRAVHVTELRTQLDAARGPLSLSTGGYTYSPLTGIVVRALDFTELRNRVK